MPNQVTGERSFSARMHPTNKDLMLFVIQEGPGGWEFEMSKEEAQKVVAVLRYGIGLLMGE